LALLFTVHIKEN